MPNPTPTRYRAGDRVRVMMAIGRNEVQATESQRMTFPQVFRPGSLGQVISDIQGQLELYVEDKAANLVHRIVLPLGARGKIEKFDHSKSWA